MDMRVLSEMRMSMNMLAVIAMRMDMSVWPIFPGLMHAPYEIREPKSDKGPRGDIASKGLERFYLHNTDAQQYPDKPQHYGTPDVPYPAKNRYKKRFDKRPLSGPRHHDKRKVVVWPYKRMDKTHGSGGSA
jgi:hypothetical protein